MRVKLKADDSVEIGELETAGECQYLHSPRNDRQGGGVGCLVKSSLKSMKKDSMKTKTFEHMEVEIKLNGKILTIILIYRPEPSKKNQYTMTEFYDEFHKFLAHYHTYNNEVIITGDFNFHMNKPSDNKVIKFNNILEMFDLVQHITSSTHRDGNTLDLVITHKTSTLNDITISELNSDHNCILFNLKLDQSEAPLKKITVRKMCEINMQNFKSDIKAHLSLQEQTTNTTEYLNVLVHTYNSTKAILDKHAPARSMTVRSRKYAPWTNSNIKVLKKSKRKAEKRRKITNLQQIGKISRTIRMH